MSAREIEIDIDDKTAYDQDIPSKNDFYESRFDRKTFRDL